ncbi:uncharacterized protein LOC107040475 [Diachasma alloeum]|uniref:uncharacterized protein LOC107040475 n=1 Tax=Diachasma alloeum TaxID=454923 RepID=UPI000738391F|nr:uncharacterized protein LOC107040475 [Diachasma alloeum]
MQSTSAENGIPQRAVDGSSGQVYNPQTCTLTRPEVRPWWYVNLLEPYMVQLVRLDFGKACCDGAPGTIVVRVGNNRPDLGTNPICNRFTGPLEEGQPLFLPCNPPMPGAFVSVHLESAAAAPAPVQLSLCEAFVYTDQALPIERCPQFRDQPPGSTATYNGKCYIFYNRQPLQFREALSFCRARGGTLVDESNPALQGFISWELWRRHRSDTSSQYWMGAVRDPKDKSVWRWTGSGDEVSVSFWSLPQGTEEECARYDGSRGWLWSDTPCSSRLNYICQHQPRACGRPEQPPNSTMVVTNASEDPVNNYQVGASVSYSCSSGSLLIGPSTRTCLDTGFYNEFPPVCKSIECGYPASIKHGEYTLINNTVMFLSQVLYSCEDGYEMTGRARLTCDIDERWNGPPPRCEPIRCDPPPTVSHSTIQLDEIDVEENLVKSTNRSLLVGSVVIYTCEKGYKLTGHRQILCLPTGLYDHAAPTCTEEPKVTSGILPKVTLRPANTRGKPVFPTRTRSTTTPLPPSTVPQEATPTRRYPPQTAEVPATIRETVHKRPTIGLQKPAPPSEETPEEFSGTHPQDNEISGSSVDNARAKINTGVPEPTGPFRVDRSDAPTHQAKLNLGAVIALGVFGAFVFLAAVITTVVILIRSGSGSIGGRRGRRGLGGVALGGGRGASAGIGRSDPSGMPSRWYTLLALPFPDQHLGRRDLTARRATDHPYSFNLSAAHRAGYFSNPSLSRGRSSKHYRHRASPDCNTVASFDSSSSESRGGLNRYYRQAWENLHETAGQKANHPPLRRKETLDEPSYRDNYRGDNVSEVGENGNGFAASKHAGDKKRHHHHHHHHHGSANEWRQSQSHHRY